ncbi:MAG TPA: DUF177 domain-containing protein [Pyrinomonadaceae bacterium]|jgi:uncharacterized protein|nr:DUF177 domain-containing protein [Pyrinomonadaceae bacterium]
MRIDVENLEKSGGKIARTYGIDELTFDEQELKVLEPVTVSGRVRQRNEVELRGDLHTKVAVPCGRCLKPVEFAIDVEFAERFTPAVVWKHEEQHELSEDDLSLAAFDGQAIELDDLVREEITLALPGHVLCDEACKGLCPNCGTDLNVSTCDCSTKQIDSRWEKLKDLRF